MPPAWLGLLVVGGATFLCALRFDHKLPRIIAKILWVLAAVARWLLVVYVVYALFVFAPDATAGYDADSRATILAATLVPLLALCAVMMPSQAAVACRSKADARRAVLTSLFQFVCTVLLYVYGVIVKHAVVSLVEGPWAIVSGIVASLLALCVTAVAFEEVLFKRFSEQKTVSGETPKTDKESE